MVLTGLRKGELASLSVSQLHPDDPAPYLELDAADKKSRNGGRIPLRADLVAELRVWLAEKLAVIQAHARGHGDRPPAKLPPDTPLFEVLDKLQRS